MVHDCPLILDDNKARKLAESFDLRFTGTSGVLVRAKELGKAASLGPVVAKIKEADFHASESLLAKILKSVGK